MECSKDVILYWTWKSRNFLFLTIKLDKEDQILVIKIITWLIRMNWNYSTKLNIRV